VHRDASLHLRARKPLQRPKRLLALQGDARLVDHLRAGDDAAFEVLYERHVGNILSFCRHMLGSQHEAEDAVQQTFVAAHRDMLRSRREISFKPWLYTIARNRCLSILRARREQASELPELSTAGLHEDVDRRGDLRELVADLQRLPTEQREALVLSELGDLSYAEVAKVLGTEVANVKGLIFRARSAMIERRDARGADCDVIRAELATVTGGGLRRSRLRYHLESCPGCTAYLAEVRRQRKLLGVALPVVPSIALHEGVMASVGIGAASAGAIGATAGGAASAGAAASAAGVAGGAASVGGVASVGTPLLGGTLAKVAIVGLLAGTTGVAVTDVVRDERGRDGGRDLPSRLVPPGSGGAGQPASPTAPGTGPAGARRDERNQAERRHAKRAGERRARGLRRAGLRGDGRSATGLIHRRDRTDGVNRTQRGQVPPREKAAGGGKAAGGRPVGADKPGSSPKPPPTNQAPKAPPTKPIPVAPKAGAQPRAPSLRQPSGGGLKPVPVKPVRPLTPDPPSPPASGP
jgi:RNA polymerase sigma factor (sigma-70 family)